MWLKVASYVVGVGVTLVVCYFGMIVYIVMSGAKHLASAPSSHPPQPDTIPPEVLNEIWGILNTPPEK